MQEELQSPGPQKRKMTVRIVLSAQAYQKKENNYCRVLHLHFKSSAIQEMYQIETVDPNYPFIKEGK